MEKFALHGLVNYFFSNGLFLNYKLVYFNLNYYHP
jgi:hypothetical protein